VISLEVGTINPLAKEMVVAPERHGKTSSLMGVDGSCLFLTGLFLIIRGTLSAHTDGRYETKQQLTVLCHSGLWSSGL
jgi:hypothetical protein